MSSNEEKSFTLSLPVAIVFASLVISGAILLTKGNTPAPAAAAVGAQPPANPVAISIRPPSAQDHIIGSPNAPVVLVEYSDFECPFCAVIYPNLKKIVEDSNGRVAWVYRNFPLDSIHQKARPAALAAECIAAELGNDAFWKFADAIFADQQSMGQAQYEQIAARLGANPQTFAQCVSSKQFDAKISADEAEGQKNGGQGTPFTIVVGKKGTPTSFSGALPLAQIQAIVKSVADKQ